MFKNVTKKAARIVIAALLTPALLWVFLYESTYTQSQLAISTATVSTLEVTDRSTAGAPQVPRDFYRTIIDNNIFRPLGWSSPRPKETYRLIGTLIPCDGKSKAQAILQKNPAGKTYTVTIGDQLDADIIVIDIQTKQVILEKAGQRRTLTLNTTPWLK